MISDDTLMGTSLMTFSVQGTGQFGPGNFTAVKQRGLGHSVSLDHLSCSQSEAASGSTGRFSDFFIM